MWIKILAALGALIVLAVVAGAMLPKAHHATRTAVFAQPPEAVWQTITDVEHAPEWRSGLARVERLEDRYGNLTWRETDRRGAGMMYEATASEPPRRWVSTIIERNAPYGGSWTFELAPEGTGTKLTITENGEIYNPLFRLMARFVFGYTATLEQYLRDLGKKLGQGVAPR
jgi:uncharacterized protein YndB with AHSA1/START domain